MKDTVIKGNGKSRSIKAPTDMPAIFEEWRAQLLAGTATLDIGLNPAGCDVVGTPLNKVNLLADDTASILGLSADATPNKAFEAIGASLSDLNADVDKLQTDVGKLKFVILKLEADGWSGSAPYTQTMNIPGMTADWVPGVPTYMPIYNSDGSVNVSETANALENVAYIKILVSGNGTLTAICPEDKPTWGIWLRVPGMVER